MLDRFRFIIRSLLHNRDEFWELVQTVDEVATALWNLKHGCHICAGVSIDEWNRNHVGKTRVKDDCSNCDGRGVITI
jgi:hypothetical protein